MDKVKILFKLGDDGWGGVSSEGLWAERCNDGFILDNIPFFKKRVCYEDIVIGKKISKGVFEYIETSIKSRNSLYRVFFEEEKKGKARKLLEKIEGLGCIYETNDLGDYYLVAINIPGDVDIDRVWEFIDSGVKDLVWEAQEGDDRHPKKNISNNLI